MVEEAIAFATKAHKGQYRKGTKKPYIVHPLEVAKIVSTMTKDEDVICAAVLHDTIEDCKGITEETLRLQFGDRVAQLVAGESEDKTKTWEERKSATIEHLKNASEELQIIGLADKLSNLRDIDKDYPIFGEEFWLRFRMKNKEAMGWYYKGIKDALEQKFKGQVVYEEYCQLVSKHFGEGPADESWRNLRER